MSDKKLWTKAARIKQDTVHNDDVCPPPALRCFSCGATSGFFTTSTWTDYGYEYDLECTACGSTEVGEDGCGFRSEDCPACEPSASAEDCELCDGYATVYPYQVDQWKERDQ